MHGLLRQWRALPAPHRRWLLVYALGATAVINIVVNAVVTWLGDLGHASVPMWSIPLAEPSTIVDTIGTFFILPLITGLLCTTAVRRDVGAGRLPPLAGWDELRRWLPDHRLRRAVRSGIFTTAVLGPLAVLLIVALRFGDLSHATFMLYHVVMAVVLGALVTPIIAVRAMIDDPAG